MHKRYQQATLLSPYLAHKDIRIAKITVAALSNTYEIYKTIQNLFNEKRSFQILLNKHNYHLIFQMDILYHTLDTSVLFFQNLRIYPI